MNAKNENNLLPRPPIVAIMGHVDHGKTTFLDYIRKTNVAAREAGGITQSIGAYEISHNGQKITFIDTPGHEAFSKMRAHGARAADLAILVIAADDSVKTQTKEALKFINEAKIPFVVAINKIDKQNSDIERVKQDLAKNEIFLEGAGGNISWQAISSKTGEGMPELLDLILLSAEVENLTFEKGEGAAGFILGSSRDPKRGTLVTGIVKNGKLETGQTIATETAKGKIKILENFSFKKVNFLEPSAPALILGFENLPEIGEEFIAGENALKTHKIKNDSDRQKTGESVPEDSQTMNLILKADEIGSLEALKDLINKIGKDLPFKIIQTSVGDIYENDIKLAVGAKAVIIGFKVKTDRAALNLAKAQKTMIINSEIIYELEKFLKEYAKKTILKEARAIEILAVFGEAKGKERIIGGRVTLGIIKNQEKFEIWQGEKQIGEGKILNLQSQRKDVAEAEAGTEVGLLVESQEPIKKLDRLVFEN